MDFRERLYRFTRKALPLTVFALTLVSFQNCSKTGVAVIPTSDAQSAGGPTDGTGGDPNGGEPVVAGTSTQSFNGANAVSTPKPIDMVWVIDNSSSMSDDVAQVQKNLNAFATSLKGSQVDIRIALISRSRAESYNTQISFPANMPVEVKQVDFMVHSYNPLLVAAVSTCPSSPANGSFCATLKANSDYTVAYGSLNTWFRANAQPVFVVVTDDDSSYLANTTIQKDNPSNPNDFIAIQKSLQENVDYISVGTFETRMNEMFGSGKYSMFGFITLDNRVIPNTDSSCGARYSTAYQTVINDTKGQAFNICAKDWSGNFAALSQSVTTYSKGEFAVTDANFIAVVSVSLNGQLLNLGSDYTVSGSHVDLNDALIQAQTSSFTVDVVYSHK